MRSQVLQVVSSPLRNAVPPSVRRGFAFAATRPATLIGRVLARSVRLPAPDVEWSLETGPLTGNGLGTLRLHGRTAEVALHRSSLSDGRSVLTEVHRQTVVGDDTSGTAAVSQASGPQDGVPSAGR